ncbi:hypothetical protein EV207_12452 [Scopulibacillus darangshiensis]|uniref:Uncharacterized protein n=1 Tax=Scopulibacillus darangshiensis TaxID=442528 RepID=A0A4R2NRK3_9BACL|nr:hypothetical protein [Scopulibacillus darangshiensis]TCP24553.1 hypothetical protein EV207_12452 [Scopulibacillus darangshiensis]
MYSGRDFTELSMMSVTDWHTNELAYFHECLKQMTPYLNSEGVQIRQDVVEEIESRGGIHKA